MLPGDGVEGLPFPEGGIVGVLASLPAQSLLSVGVENCLIIFGLPGRGRQPPSHASGGRRPGPARHPPPARAPGGAPFPFPPGPPILDEQLPVPLIPVEPVRNLLQVLLIQVDLAGVLHLLDPPVPRVGVGVVAQHLVGDAAVLPAGDDAVALDGLADPHGAECIGDGVPASHAGCQRGRFPGNGSAYLLSSPVSSPVFSPAIMAE